MMKGKGAPRDTLFGVIGKTKEDSSMRSLGGLMITTTKGASPADVAMKSKSPAPKTHIPKQHYGQIPYAGKFMSELGKEVS
jgi:hypothetical protein